jgi:hypothetical protein
MDYLNHILEILDISGEKKEEVCKKLQIVEEYVHGQNLETKDKIVLATGLSCTVVMLSGANVCPEDVPALIKNLHEEWNESRAENPGLDNQQFFYDYYMRFMARQN